MEDDRKRTAEEVGWESPSSVEAPSCVGEGAGRSEEGEREAAAGRVSHLARKGVVTSAAFVAKVKAGELCGKRCVNRLKGSVEHGCGAFFAASEIARDMERTLQLKRQTERSEKLRADLHSVAHFDEPKGGSVSTGPSVGGLRERVSDLLLLTR